MTVDSDSSFANPFFDFFRFSFLDFWYWSYRGSNDIAWFGLIDDSDSSSKTRFSSFFRVFFIYSYLEVSVVATISRSFDWLSILIRVSKIRFSIFFDFLSIFFDLFILKLAWERLSCLVFTYCRLGFEFRNSVLLLFYIKFSAAATVSFSFGCFFILIRGSNIRFSIFFRFSFFLQWT